MSLVDRWQSLADTDHMCHAASNYSDVNDVPDRVPIVFAEKQSVS